MTIYYTTGTVTLTNNSTAVTGSGTAWLTNGIRAGDWLIVRNQIAVIDSVTSNTALTIETAWVPASASVSAYAIARVDDGVRALQATNNLLAAFNAGPAQGRFGDGSAATPGVGFTSQTNTGLFRPATSVLALSVNGTERLRLTTAGAQLTGLLTGTAVTQSTSDVTAGRLLKVGDYGLGPAITLTSGVDLNALTASGFYYNPSAGNTPGNNYPASSAGSLVNIRRTDANWVQEFTSYSGNSLATQVIRFIRSYGGAGWSPWVEVVHQGRIIGTVSQTAGVATGAVIQRGSNALGEFVRFADGTQICTRAVRVTGSYNVVVSATTPATFLAGTMRGGGCISETGIVGLTAAQSRDISASLSVQCNVEFGTRWQFAIASSFTVPAGAEFDVLLTATGRWF